MECSEDDRLSFTTFLLEDRAYHWWQTVSFETEDIKLIILVEDIDHWSLLYIELYWECYIYIKETLPNFW